MKISVIIVTFNRLSDLKTTLQAYESQSYAPDSLLVVDNCSTDGTAEYLHSWQEDPSASFSRKVIALPENIGGSGGFYTGMKAAMESDCDWVFVADDDALPERDMLEQLVTFIREHPEQMRHTAALCTSVDDRGKMEGNHRCILRRTPLGMLETFVPEKEYQKESFELDIYSFVGAMIRRKVLETAGLPRKDFFIYNDDYEHAVRVRKTGKILCVPEAVMHHENNLRQENAASWRDYYGTRNAVIMHLEHFGAWGGFMRAARRLAVSILSRDPIKVKLILAGIKDAYAGRTGIHPVYKPGWKA